MRRQTDGSPSQDSQPQDEQLRALFRDIAADGATGRRAFGELYLRSRTRLGVYLRSKLHNAPNAHDVLQDVFLNLWKGRGRLAAVREPWAWLMRSARNASISWRRRHRGASATMNAIPEGAWEQLLEEWARDQKEAELWRDELPICAEALALLAARSPDAVHALLCAANGMSGKEMATELNRSIGAAKQLLSKARRDLEEIHAQLSLPRPRRRPPP